MPTRTPEERAVYNARMKAWRAENSEKKKATDRAYYEYNRESVKAQRSSYRRANPEKAVERRADYYRRNKEAIILKSRARKQNILAVNELLPGEWDAMIEACGNRCIVPGCGTSPVTKDHVKPFSLGGRHHISNLQPLCRSCNSRKGDEEIDYRG